MSRNLVRLFQPYRLPILSGILIGTSYIPFPPWASLFAFVPLWLFWQKQTHLKQILIGGVLTSFTLTLIGFNWVTYLLHEFGNMPWIAAGLVMLVYAAVANLYIPLAGALWFYGQKRWQWKGLHRLLTLGALTAFCEYYALTIFDWNMGYTWFASGLPLFQLAEYIGFSGLSALTILASVPLYQFWVQRKQRGLRSPALLTVIALFVLMNIFGLVIKNRISPPDRSARILLVQANIGNIQKKAAELGLGFRKEILQKYIDITQLGLESDKETPIAFALWPETAFPTLMGETFKYKQHPRTLRQFLRNEKLALVTGAYSTAENSDLITNSLFSLDSEGEIIAPHYSKSILLAFGEYIPGESLLPKIRGWLPPTGHFAPGPGPTVLLKQGDLKLGPQICYESLFPYFSKKIADLGAQMIVNVTNDSWYGAWQEPYQHMYMTLARAVEFRRPVVRVTNTGISTAALADGTVLQRSPIHKEWFGLYDISYKEIPTPTFYQRWFWLGPALLWVALITLVLWGMRARNSSH